MIDLPTSETIAANARLNAIRAEFGAENVIVCNAQPPQHDMVGVHVRRKKEVR